LAPRRFWRGEDTAAYDEFLVRISGALRPADILEEIWVRDVVDLVWEAFRLRRLKANLMTAVAHEGLREILETLIDWSDAKEILPRPGLDASAVPSSRWMSSLRQRG
jgi:hypothetical protein